MSKNINITNHNFGCLTVIQRQGTNKHGSALWLCKCVCGNKKIYSYTLLKMEILNLVDANNI